MTMLSIRYDRYGGTLTLSVYTRHVDYEAGGFHQVALDLATSIATDRRGGGSAAACEMAGGGSVGSRLIDRFKLRGSL